jgi:hypothetical protein
MSVSAPCCLVLARAVLPGNEGDGGAAPCALASRSPASPGTGTTSGSRSSRRQMAATPGNSGRRTCMRRATSGSGSTGSSVRPMRCALRSVVRVLISTRRVGAVPMRRWRRSTRARPGHRCRSGQGSTSPARQPTSVWSSVRTTPRAGTTGRCGSRAMRACPGSGSIFHRRCHSSIRSSARHLRVARRARPAAPPPVTFGTDDGWATVDIA